MTILGLDPGIARCGYAVVSDSAPNTLVRCGVLTTPTGTNMEDRLTELGIDLEQLITDTKPDRAVVEDIFFGKNAKTAMMTAHARGVLLYILRQHHITIESLTPLQIKSHLTGFGGADKHQVQEHVKHRLKLDAIPQPDDAADALAAALCVLDAVPHKLPG